MGMSNVSYSYYNHLASGQLYIAGGSALDWAHGVAGIPWTYTLELPPEPQGYPGYNGFIIPAKFITPILREAVTGVLYLAKSIIEEPEWVPEWETEYKKK